MFYSNLRSSKITKKRLADPPTSRSFPALTNFRDSVIFNVGGADYQSITVDGVTSMYDIKKD